ncbi:MAG: hypothetical protein HQ558_03035, partial [Candidatus Omnitrophica bacterium]|nr:hypothetical protein [Candidatus Omnitrophota bacterium]
ALYEPDFNDYLTGNNLKYIGLAAGKVSTYLQHGVPVLVNETGSLSDYVMKYKLGIVCGDEIVLPKASELNGYSERCYAFFEEKLDLNKTIQPLLIKIKELIG